MALHDDLVVFQGQQYQRAKVPAGVDASGLPTLTEWFASQRTGGAAVEAPKPTGRKAKS